MKALYMILATMLTLSCSPANDEKKVDNGSTPSFTPSTSSKKKRQKVQIPLYVGPRTGSFGLTDDIGFGLADATNFSILLTGCSTGWTTTATAANSTLDVYKDDNDCLAKLMQYSWQSKTYVPKSGSDFTTWLANDTAIFENNADPTDTMEVRVVSTLDDPISGTEAITYLFYEIANGGSTTILDDDVGDPHALTVGGQSAPAFTVYSASFVGVSATGAGQFVFVLQCDINLAANKCDENALGDITYKLIEDSYTSAPTLANARTVFATAGTSIGGGDIIAASGTAPTRGGFTTVTLDGPDQMHLKPNMLLILRVDGQADADLTNDSFTYFNIDVETLTY